MLVRVSGHSKPASRRLGQQIIPTTSFEHDLDVTVRTSQCVVVCRKIKHVAHLFGDGLG
jgi:hypothetical protein